MEKTEPKEINSQMEKCLSKCERITGYFEKKPLNAKYSTDSLEKFVQGLYKNFLIPVYDALSHSNPDMNKELFLNLKAHVDFYESLIDNQRSLTHSIDARLKEQDNNFSAKYDFTKYRTWNIKDCIGNESNSIQEIKSKGTTIICTHLVSNKNHIGIDSIEDLWNIPDQK